jgi:nitrite reductase/ring-hydroxylating ferredoxin subunit
MAKDRTGDASRRAVIGGFVGAGVGVPLLVACGSDDADSAGSDSAGGSGGSGGTTSSGAIGKTSDVPVGGAKIYTAEKVLVSQPTSGDFKAFSTVCTHQGCAIKQLNEAEKEIECSCHHSRFSITDGSVKKGPANKPLSELKVSVSGEDLTVS